MHRPGRGLGEGVRQLKEHLDADSAVMRRFKTLGAASTWDGRLHHLRSLITQLRGEDIWLDHGLLARDLYQLQWPSTADRVRQRWVRDVHRTPKTSQDRTTTSTEGETR